MDLQGADARRQLENARYLAGLEPIHQGVGAEAEREVQDRRTVFHQQVAITGAAVAYFREITGGGDLVEDAAAGTVPCRRA